MSQTEEDCFKIAKPCFVPQDKGWLTHPSSWYEERMKCKFRWPMAGKEGCPIGSLLRLLLAGQPVHYEAMSIHRLINERRPYVGTSGIAARVASSGWPFRGIYSQEYLWLTVSITAIQTFIFVSGQRGMQNRALIESTSDIFLPCSSYSSAL